MKHVQEGFAIVVGVSSYDPDFRDLPYAKNDALRICQALIRHGGFDSKRVYLLADEAELESDMKVATPTRSNVLEKIKYAAEAAGNDDLILLYFACHGAEISKNPYLFTSDTKLNVLADTAVDVNVVNGYLEKSKARCIVRVFDACRSSFSEGRGLPSRMSKGFENALMVKASGWATFNACSSGELAHESPEFEQGVFSKFLCDGLEGKAANESGQVTLEGLVDYVKISVANWCDQQTTPQSPHLQSDISGSLILSQVKVANRKDSVVAEHSPLAALQMGLDSHLSATAADVRNLSFTNPQQHEQVSELLFSAARSLMHDFSHPILTVEESNVGALNALGAGPPWNEFDKETRRLAIQSERKETKAIKYSFVSSEVAVVTSDIFIASARFSYFYCIWMCHVCRTEQLQGLFKPEPLFTKGIYTFKPRGALDESKMASVVTEIFERTSQSILEWSGQLRQFVDSRIDPLRNIGDIIG